MGQQDEKRSPAVLSEEQFEAIAERAADRALAKVYEQIGRSIVTKILWVAGAAALAVAAWMKGSGKL
jgi:putative NADH-flavin reductase